jgi:ferritin-like metal-binding protein YciE
MKGLVEEAGEATEGDMDESLTDSAIICAAQKVEHYEIAGYGTLAAWAKSLGLDDVAGLLEETLEEEKAADKKLSEVADGILVEAASMEGGSQEDEEEEEATVESPRKKAASKGSNGQSSRHRAG